MKYRQVSQLVLVMGKVVRKHAPLLQGTGPSVPKYLSFDGPVRNRHLGKRDTLLLIRDIWREKAAVDAEVGMRVSLFLSDALLYKNALNNATFTNLYVSEFCCVRE